MTIQKKYNSWVTPTSEVQLNCDTRKTNKLEYCSSENFDEHNYKFKNMFTLF